MTRSPFRLRTTGTLVRAFLFACLALVAGLVPTPATAQAGRVGQAVPVCVAPMRPALSARQLFDHPTGFDCSRAQTDYGSGDFDVIATNLPPGLAARQPMALRFASLWQGRSEVFALYADGTIARTALDQYGMTRHIQLGAIVEVPLEIRQQPVVGLLWRIRDASNTRGIMLAASVATPAESARSNLIMGAIYAGFGALCLALAVHNLGLWAALRYRFQLAYCVMVVTLSIYAFSSSGALAWAFPDIANIDRIRINYATLAIATVANLSFARAFFEDRVFTGWLGKLANAACALVLVAALVFVLFAPVTARPFDRFFAVSYLILLATILPVLARAFTQRSDYLWLFAIGWSVPVIFAGVRLANGFHLIPYSFWVDQSTILAMTFEALFSSLAIAYRIHLLSRERDAAREQEIAARILAATDPLTGLLNRRAFLEQGLGRTEPQLLLLADIDHFKRVNETIGHDGGDEVLRVFARALRASTPDEALIARLGGEEFAILAPADSRLSAVRVLDGLRAERMPFDVTVTASIGACTGPLETEIDWKRLYRQADLALFEAKAAGRDRARHTQVDDAA
jgi:diguanylate cyclase (GGDEF)-like protein